MKAAFLAARLSRMTPSEICHRLARSARASLDGPLGALFPPAPRAVDQWMAIDLSGLRGNRELMSVADNLLENRLTIFSRKRIRLGDEVDFNRDYSSGTIAPRDRSGARIDYRDRALVGDVKYVWELNRQLFLFPLAYAYSTTGRREYLRKIEELMDAWFRQNPFPMGINWSSALEASIRLVNWSFCWAFLHDKLDGRLASTWIESIYRHCLFVTRNFSMYSSANNHLIGEALGLFAAAKALPRFPESGKWGDKALAIISREAELQFHPDGIDKEQAVYYQATVTDMLFMALCFCRQAGIAYPGNLVPIVERSISALASLRSPGGYIPKFGDEDGAVTVELGARRIGVYQSLINTGARLFGRDDFPVAGMDEDLKTAIYLRLLGGDPAAFARGPGEAAPLRKRFDFGGYYLIDLESPSGRMQRLIFDCGELGYGRLAAHGHADALSFVFSVGEQPVFVDPGTYAYYGDAGLRSYFRGTRAHNAVCIDGTDQSKALGSFMWGRRAKSELITFEEGRRVAGAHDGYARLGDTVRVTREISVDRGSGEWRLTDAVRCRKRHAVTISFHLHPAISAVASGQTVQLRWPGHECVLSRPGEMALSIDRGEDGAGWYSPAYDEIEETNVLRFTARIDGSREFAFSWKMAT